MDIQFDTQAITSKIQYYYCVVMTPSSFSAECFHSDELMNYNALNIYIQ